MPDDVAIGHAGRTCARCEEKFTDGQDVCSVLGPDAGGEWPRVDYCTACWSTVREGAGPDQFFLCWRTKFTDRDAANRTPASQYTPLLSICYDALQADDPAAEGLAYLTAMVLRRQKVFRYIRAARDDATARSALVFFDKVNETEVRVPDPQLTPEELAVMRQELQARLAPEGPDDDEVPAQEAVRESH